MNRSPIITRSLLSVLFCFIVTGMAQAQLLKAYVSSVSGNDSNTCMRATPCRNFQRAIDVVTSGGQVIALDSGGYGPMNITKSVSVIGDGVSASVGNGNTAGSTAVTVAGANIVVVLRTLLINGFGAGDTGVYFTNGAALYMENCIVEGFTNFGILVSSLAGTGPSALFVKDTISRNNGNDGLVAFPDATVDLRIEIDRSRFENNGSAGVSILNSTKAAVRETVLASNGFGFDVGQGGAVLNAERCTATNNQGDGFFADLGSTIRVTSSSSTNNGGRGFYNFGGTFESFKTNVVRGNALGDTFGTITSKDRI